MGELPFRMLGVTAAMPPVALADTLRLAELVEQRGLGMVAVGDVHADCFSMLGAFAGRTSRVELFASIAGWTRSPVATAIAARSLHEVSGGRFRLGLGPMPKQWSEDWHGVDYAHPAERMRDYVAAIRAAMRSGLGAPAAHDGPYYRFHGFQRAVPPPQDADPPIYLGVTRARMTQLAGEVADGAILNVVSTLDWICDVQVPALERGLARSGRTRADLDVGIAVLCAIDDDAERAFAMARLGLAFYLIAPYFTDLLRHHGFEREIEVAVPAALAGDFAGAAAALRPELIERMALFGTPDDVRRQALRYAGIVDFLQLTPPIGNPADVMQEQSERIVATFGAR